MSRREEIIQAALTLVHEEGAEAMSVRNVAAKAGIGASTLRYYFPTHNDLVQAVATAATIHTLNDLTLHNTTIPAHTRLTECLCQFLPHTQDQLPILETLLSAYASCFSEGVLVGNPMLKSVGDTSRATVERWLETLHSEGHLFPLPIPQLAQLLLTHLNGIVVTIITEAPDYSLDQAAFDIGTLVALLVPDNA